MLFGKLTFTFYIYFKFGIPKTIAISFVFFVNTRYVIISTKELKTLFKQVYN